MNNIKEKLFGKVLKLTDEQAEEMLDYLTDQIHAYKVAKIKEGVDLIARLKSDEEFEKVMEKLKTKREAYKKLVANAEIARNQKGDSEEEN